ncbi:uncharacterized protein BP5553_02731 [Venustampulla echinocandica]|uniref:Uncharacterized protein n=1 Tax=Venustampulla echinocandica TaxID=2656787 RepID=A0A370TS87_9HELO|nr:uncharacterized protein BP5553_02731 [Venustampulla echinocandica]RDL38391.1 hypothetical protein BP5553_02731 [Venustampulla echinocandica]
MAPPRSGASGYQSPNRGRPASSIRSSAIPLDKYLVFGGDWYFRKDGIVDVKNRFQAALQTEGKAAKCEWNDETYTFDITCSPQDAKLVHHLFFGAISSVIKEEEQKNGIREAVICPERNESDSDSDSSNCSDSDSNESDAAMRVDEDGPIESWKIQRLTAWMAQQGLQPGPQFGAAAQELDSTKTSADQYPPEIVNLQFKHIWRSGADIHCVTDGDLQQLNQLTGCQLVKGLDGGMVYIGAGAEQDIHLAVLKLDNIRKYSGPKTYNAHLFYTEETEDFELAFKYLTGVKISKKRFFQTTLLDNVEELSSDINNYDNLDKALTIRCAPWVPHQSLPHKSQYMPTSTVKLPVSITKGEDKGKEREEWVGFIFNQNQSCSGNPLRHFSLQQPEDNALKGIAAKPSKDKALETAHQPRQLESDPKVAEIERWNAHVPKAAPVTPKSAKVELPVTNRKPFWDSYREWGSKPDKEAAPLRQSPASAANTIGGNGPLSPIGTSHNLPAVALRQEQKARAKKPEETKAPRNVSGGDRRSSSMKTTPNNNLVKVGAVATPLPNEPIRCSLLDEGISNLGSGFEPLTPVQQFPIDSLQAVDEVGTRTYRSTMNQKAGKPRNSMTNNQNPTRGRLPLPSPPRYRESKTVEDPPADPTIDFVETFKTNFDMMMQELRGFRGSMAVEAEFGRILIRDVKSKLVADKDMPDLTMDRKKLDFVLSPSPFPNGSQPSASFTNKLTTSAADSDDLVKMKKSDGTALWESRISFPWEIIYEFIFHDINPGMPREPFTIEIDGERFSSEIKFRQDMGSIFVHGAKRHWDFRVVASGVENNQDLKDRYRPLEEAIRESLFVPPNARKPELCFELSKSLRNKFKLDEIRVHRISRYRSRDRNSVLKISEIQALDTNARGVPEMDLVVFKAWLNTIQSRKACQKLDSWYQASISCIKAHEMLKENKTLELGEEAGWTPVSLSRIDTAKALVVPACQMLKQMDAIGYHNDNGVERKTRAPPPTPAGTKAPEPEIMFW